MKYARIKELETPVSRFILGTDTLWLNPLGRISEALGRGSPSVRLLEFAFSQGINAFDTAPLYPSEPLLGYWMARAGLRDQVLLISKCAHPHLLTRRPRLSRKDIDSDIQRSLKRLRTDYIDILLVHYDRELVPSAQVVDWLSDHKAKGNIRAFGLSNWRYERVVEAQKYAVGTGGPGLSAVSPHFSLIAWNDPLWPGAQSIAGDEGCRAREYYRHNDISVLAWSPLSRGFFSKRLRHATGWWQKRRKRHLECSFGNEANDAKYSRAQQLGQMTGFTAVQVALAYLLNQEVSVFPIIGCQNEKHITENIRALDLALTDAEIEWLELRRETR